MAAPGRWPGRGRSWQFEHNYPGVHDQNSSVPRELYRLPMKDLTLATSVTEVAWHGDGSLSVKGTAEIRHLETKTSSSLRIALVVGGAETPLAVRRYDATDTHGDPALVGFEIRLGKALLGKLKGTGGAGALHGAAEVGPPAPARQAPWPAARQPGLAAGCVDRRHQLDPAGSRCRRRLRAAPHGRPDAARPAVSQTADAPGAAAAGSQPSVENPKLQVTRPLAGQDQ